MNKTFFLVIGIVISGYTVQGQSRLGLKAGLNVANQVKTISVPQVGAIKQETRPFIGYQLGVFYKSKVHRQFLVSLETNLSVVGSGKTLMTDDGKVHDTHEKLGYIELPLALQYSLKKIYFGLGAGVGFKIFSKLKNFENRTYNLTSYRTVDLAGNLLAGYRLTSTVDINIRYSHGVMNMYANPGYAKAKNRFLTLSFLYELK